MKKKTLLVLLILTIVGMLFILADSIYDMWAQIRMIQHLRDAFSESVSSQMITERVPYLIESIISFIICLFTFSVLIFAVVGISKNEKLTIKTEEELKIKAEKIERRKQNQIKHLAEKIEKLKRDDK